jgi:hypothetical protein
MSAFDPISWLVSLAGLIYDWLLSRPWLKILLGSIPFLLLLCLSAIVWIGGQLDPGTLAEKYQEIGAEEVKQWEENLFQTLTATAKPSTPDQAPDDLALDPAIDGNSDGDGTSETERAKTISPYSEMLFRRIELLSPNDQSQFVIGTNLLMRGAVPQGQKMLKRIAPDDSPGDPKAHTILALSYLSEFAKTQDRQILPLLQHHAQHGSRVGQCSERRVVAGCRLAVAARKAARKF